MKLEEFFKEAKKDYLGVKQGTKQKGSESFEVPPEI